MLKFQNIGLIAKKKYYRLIEMKDCTLIIPTYHRSNFLSVLLKYVEEFSIDCPIIVADGSTEDYFLNKNKEIINSLKKKNFKIEHFIDQSFFLKRIYLASKLVKTNYCKINTDDDFFSANYIQKAIDLLANDKSIATVTGYSVSFHLNPSNIKKSQFFLGEKENSNFKSILDRFYYSKSNWYPWSMYRTKTFENIFEISKQVTDNIPSSNDFNEAMIFRLLAYTMKTQTLIEGKVKYINKCMNITTYHDSNWGKKHKIESTMEYLLEKNFIESIDKLKNIVIRKNNISDKLIDKLIELVIVNDKHFYKPKHKRNLKERIFNLSISKLINYIKNEVKILKKNHLFVPIDGKNIINFLKKNNFNI